MGFFLAIDAGGTKTTCLLADETKVLGRASTGSVKIMRAGEAEATARLRTMLSELSMDAGVGLGEVTRTCIGLAGFTIAAVREWAAREIGDVVGGELLLCGDEEIALDGAFSGGPESSSSQAPARTSSDAPPTTPNTALAAGVQQ